MKCWLAFKRRVAAIVLDYNFPDYIILFTNNFIFMAKNKKPKIYKSRIIVLEYMELFLGSYFVNFFKYWLAFQRRFLALVPSYNFSEHITNNFVLTRQKLPEWVYQCFCNTLNLQYHIKNCLVYIFSLNIGTKISIDWLL